MSAVFFPALYYALCTICAHCTYIYICYKHKHLVYKYTTVKKRYYATDKFSISLKVFMYTYIPVRIIKRIRTEYSPHNMLYLDVYYIPSDILLFGHCCRWYCICANRHVSYVTFTTKHDYRRYILHEGKVHLL